MTRKYVPITKAYRDNQHRFIGAIEMGRKRGIVGRLSLHGRIRQKLTLSDLPLSEGELIYKDGWLVKRFGKTYFLGKTEQSVYDTIDSLVEAGGRFPHKRGGEPWDRLTYYKA